MQMYVQGERQGRHLDLRDQPDASSQYLSEERHASVRVTP